MRRTTPTRGRSGRPLVQDLGGPQRPVLPHRRPASGRCLRDVPEDVPPPVRSGPGSLLHSTRPQLGRPAQENRARAADYDQHLFIEKRMRGGISMVSKRHARANNPRVEGYDPEKPNSHNLYLDANNLCGWAMSQPLPAGTFWWEEDCETLPESLVSHPADSPEGLILEVDLEYPEELHKAHNAYALARERMVVQGEWMSEYQHNLQGVGV